MIDADGNKQGLKPIDEALKIAKDASLDLVQVSSSESEPVVCKILDYGKLVFEKKKIYQIQNLRKRRLLSKRLNLDLQLIQMTII